MRDRKKQRLLRKLKEKGLSPKDETGLPDPTPFEAVKRIIEKEKREVAGDRPEGSLWVMKNEMLDILLLVCNFKPVKVTYITVVKFFENG